MRVFRAALGLSALCMASGAFAQSRDGSAAPIIGLYRGFPAVPQFGAATGVTYLFSANGDVYKGWPGTRPVANFDFARARAGEPSNTGKYTIAGDKITFRWSNGETETASFSRRPASNGGRTLLAVGPNFCYKIVAWSRSLSGAFEPSTIRAAMPILPRTPPAISPASRLGRTDSLR